MINVPKGLYAYLEITGNTNSTKLTVTDSVGNIDWVPGIVNQEEYFLLDPQFSVYLESKAEGKFGMKVSWKKIGPFNPSSEPVYPNLVPTVKTSSDCDKGLLIYSNTNVSLTSVRPPSNEPKTNWYMRNTVVFDGRSMDDKLIGNLWQIYESGNHIISSGKYMTLYSFVPSIKADSYALIQDYENVRRFSTYKGVSCFNENLCPVIIDARNGTGAAVRMSRTPHFLEEVDLASSSILTVYTGTVEPSHQLIQYSYVYSNFPFSLKYYFRKKQKLENAQKFNGVFTTYSVDQQIGIIYLSSENLDSNWTNIFDGKSGILASKYLGDSSSDQNVQEIFSGPINDIYRMTLNVKNTGFMGDSTLTVTMSSEGKVVFNEQYNSKQPPPETINANGNKVSINYVTNGSNTTGIFMNFDFSLVNSTDTSVSLFTETTTTPTNYTKETTPETTTKLSSNNFSTLLFIFSFLLFVVFE
uniref:CUB_2 domain-containing protein n=1 Tax=Caenorhabditis tropicalis TaxID=1561998 RepID=A0A1I7T107_9PELO